MKLLENQRNKLGKCLEDYRYKRCGYLHAAQFVHNKPLKQCYRCHDVGVKM
ncbi:MAG: hypothetical protein ABSB71_13350 [Candidatus Bathyarchaeia archaeon]|jgi:hypothetical protein